jgi:RNA polymerase sigma-70 factor (ECF subfamily)
MVGSPEVSDEDLALHASSGDKDAFGGLYNRYFRGIYDLVVRMVRDPETAADVVQDVFVKAWESLQKRSVTGNVRAWLFTIARHTAIDDLRRTKLLATIVAREIEQERSRGFEEVDAGRLSNPQALLEDQEMVDLVWTSATALGPTEYSLLDLHIRRDLSAAELATRLGVSRGSMNTRLSRLRDSLEESVAVALLMRRGRDDCAQLNAILSARGSGEVGRETRRVVQMHLQECELCADSRRRYLAPAEIFSALALVPVADGMQAGIWQRVVPLIAPGAVSSGLITAAADRLAHGWSRASTPVRLASIAGLGGLVAVPLAVVLFAAASGGGAGPEGGGDARPTVDRFPASSEPPGRSPRNERVPASSTPAVAGVVASPDGTATATPTPTTASARTPAATSSDATSTITPSPAPAPAATPVPITTPTPAPTPTPSVQTDVQLLSVKVTAPVSALPGPKFQVSAVASLYNAGPAASVLVDLTFAFADTAGCAVSPSAPRTVPDRTLPIDKVVEVSLVWDVTCTNAGSHTFVVDASIAIDPSQMLTDANPANNSGSGSATTAI